MKKRGLSTIVVTLIIILLSLVAVGVVWTVVNNLIKDNSTEVGTALTKLTINLKLMNVYEDQGDIYAEVKRGSGAGDLTKIKFIIYTLDDSEIITQESSIKELESEKFVLELSKLNITKVIKISIVPVFRLSDGTEKVGNILDTYYIKTLEEIPAEEPDTEKCSDGTLYDQCSTTQPKYCDNGNLILDCDVCGCPLGWDCETCTSLIPPIEQNEKLSSNYIDRSAFLISDENWKDVLSLVPVTTWEEDSTIKKYPTLIYHSEGTNVDIDSIIYFLQQYTPTKLTIVGQTSTEIDNLLTASLPLGAGLSSSDIIRISTDNYLNYWESFDTLVYVQNNYRFSLFASTYASIINAPLIIEGTSFDTETTFSGRNIICVGEVSPSESSCKEQYTLEELQQAYKSKTGTDKIILTNPNDLGISYPSYTGTLYPLRTASSLSNLFTKTSLAAPFLASAKKELLVSTTETDYLKIDVFIKSEISSINAKYLTIMAAPNLIPFRRLIEGTLDVYRSLDQTQYADTDNNGIPNIYTGRIMGMTLSDVSSYVARALFYDELSKSSNMLFMPSRPNDFDLYATRLNEIGYNTISTDSWTADDWEGKGLISYQSHGNENWAGLWGTEIPLLDNTFMFNGGCSACATQDVWSICNNVMRKGAIFFVGPVGVAFSGNAVPRETLNGIYYYNLPLGAAFKYAHDFQNAFNPPPAGWYVTLLLGDPTLKLDVPYLLPTPLCSAEDLDVEVCDGYDNNCDGQIDENCVGYLEEPQI